MKLRNLLITSAGLLSFTVITIALVTIYFLNTIESHSKKSSALVKIRTEALHSKYFVIQIQQFLTDASATGEDGGIEDAKENLNFLRTSLGQIKTNAPNLAHLVNTIENDSNDFFKTGIEMVQGYKKGQAVGNAIMKRPGDGFDAFAEKLSEEIQSLEKATTQRQESAEQNIASQEHQLLIQTIVLSIIEFFIMLGSFYVIFRRTRPLEIVVSNLGENANHLETATNAVTASANALSSANSQQASATQQTAASLEQIRAMVGKTAENSSFLQARAEETNRSVSTGKQALDAVIHTIQEIKDRQNNIVTTVEQTNQEISQIVTLIAEIGNKTKIINEIVFQTKLLSFNASVEAARAGEHGRGFAVVAEEVGGLAQMSGNASKEISDLLETSIEKVKSIVEEGRNRLALTLEQSLAKIEQGVGIAHQCEESFETIITQMNSVNSTTHQTSTAIQETVKGLDEISKAIEDLDQSTRSNAETSSVATQTSTVLSEQLVALKSSINEVNRVIAG